MNRRGFIASLAAAIAAPAVFIPKADDAYKWIKGGAGVWVLNPEWVNAPYELMAFNMKPLVVGGSGVILHRRSEAIPNDIVPIHIGFAPRYNDAAGGPLQQHIPPFIPQPTKHHKLFS